MFYDCVVCLGEPCNEVHGMLLVIDTNKRGGRCLCICVCRGLLPSMVNAPGLRFGVACCSNVKRNH